MGHECRREAVIRDIASQRVQAAWSCVSVLCPDTAIENRKVLARKILDLCRGDAYDPKIEVAPAQVTEMVWRNSQCINPHCPMVLFSDQLAAELNEFFKHEE